MYLKEETLQENWVKLLKSGIQEKLSKYNKKNGVKPNSNYLSELAQINN